MNTQAALIQKGRTMNERYTFHKASEQDAGVRIDKYIHASAPLAPYSSIQRAIRKGDIRINGARAKPETKLSEDDEVRIFKGWFEHVKNLKEEPERFDSWKNIIKSWIIYQDDNLIIINKPAGIASQGGSGQKVSIDRMPWDPPSRIVHRLDKETSGVMVLASSVAAARYMGESFKKLLIEKTYIAIAHGTLPQKSGTIDAALVKIRTRDGGAIMVPSDAKDALRAMTTYKVLSSNNGLSMVEISPKTGRMHQIRVHMKHIGNSIVGDHLYGRDRGGLFLHCSGVAFDYKGHKINATAAAPERFHEVIA